MPVGPGCLYQPCFSVSARVTGMGKPASREQCCWESPKSPPQFTHGPGSPAVSCPVVTQPSRQDLEKLSARIGQRCSQDEAGNPGQTIWEAWGV